MSTAYKKVLQKKQTSEVSVFDKETRVAQQLVRDDTSSDGSNSDNDINKGSKKQHKAIKNAIDEVKEEDEGELRAFKDAEPESKEWKNRQRTLILCARGVNSRFRHLLSDLIDLLPHCKKENKIERKIAKDYIDDLCYQRSCNNCIYFEARKQTDFFMWVMKSPSGPSIKFAV